MAEVQLMSLLLAGWIISKLKVDSCLRQLYQALLLSNPNVKTDLLLTFSSFLLYNADDAAERLLGKAEQALI